MIGKVIVVGIIVALMAVVIGWNINNVQQKEVAADVATEEYIQALEEVYGPDRTNWPKCHLDAIAYSETNTLIRVIQYGTT